MLSNGEYVVNADATAKNLGLLEHLNANKMADGGIIADNVGYGLLGAAYESDVNALTVMGLQHPSGLPEAPAPSMVPGGSTGAVPSVPSSRAANEAIVQSVFASQFGWSGSEWDATIQLLMQESGFNNTAQNPTSTAYGMFQFLNSTWPGYGVAKTSDPTQQAVAGGRYIKARYGDPIGAENHERAYHWFEQGGYLPPGRDDGRERNQATGDGPPTDDVGHAGTHRLVRTRQPSGGAVCDACLEHRAGGEDRQPVGVGHEGRGRSAVEPDDDGGWLTEEPATPTGPPVADAL